VQDRLRRRRGTTRLRHRRVARRRCERVPRLCGRQPVHHRDDDRRTLRRSDQFESLTAPSSSRAAPFLSSTIFGSSGALPGPSSSRRDRPPPSRSGSRLLQRFRLAAMAPGGPIRPREQPPLTSQTSDIRCVGPSHGGRFDTEHTLLPAVIPLESCPVGGSKRNQGLTGESSPSRRRLTPAERLRPCPAHGDDHLGFLLEVLR